MYLVIGWLFWVNYDILRVLKLINSILDSFFLQKPNSLLSQIISLSKKILIEDQGQAQAKGSSTNRSYPISYGKQQGMVVLILG